MQQFTKRHHLFILFVLIFCGSQSYAGRRISAADTLRYQLVWADEFNGSKVDTSVWTFETGNSGWGNNEHQYYQAANAVVQNGNLVINARKESVGTALYTSARMKTQRKKNFLYGRVEARIKIPVGQGLWPAFWMLGENISTVGWPKSGEIDIMEHINTDSLLYGTAHWDGGKGHVQSGDTILFSPSAYHVYGVEWTPAFISWHIDGKEYHRLNIAGNNNTAAFHQPFFILLNFAVGGNWPGHKIDEAKLPASMYVDYVRVYQLK